MEQTIILAADEESDPITVTPCKAYGIESTEEVWVYAKGGSKVFPAGRFVGCGIMVPPNDTITITAGPDGATVILAAQD